MRCTGIVRRIDDLGRVVIPRELRAKTGIVEGDPLEIFVDDDMVIFRPYDYDAPVIDRLSKLKKYIQLSGVNVEKEKELVSKIEEMLQIIKRED